MSCNLGLPALPKEQIKHTTLLCKLTTKTGLDTEPQTDAVENTTCDVGNESRYLGGSGVDPP